MACVSIKSSSVLLYASCMEVQCIFLVLPVVYNNYIYCHERLL